jgi:hypothetical protein
MLGKVTSAPKLIDGFRCSLLGHTSQVKEGLESDLRELTRQQMLTAACATVRRAPATGYGCTWCILCTRLDMCTIIPRAFRIFRWSQREGLIESLKGVRSVLVYPIMLESGSVCPGCPQKFNILANRVQ